MCARHLLIGNCSSSGRSVVEWVELDGHLAAWAAYVCPPSDRVTFDDCHSIRIKVTPGACSLVLKQEFWAVWSSHSYGMRVWIVTEVNHLTITVVAHKLAMRW